MRKLIIIILIFQSLKIFSQEEVIINLDKQKLNTTDIYIKVDTMPDFICEYEGDYITKVKTFINANLQWPNSEIDCQGTVYLQFVVEPDSAISNINIIRGLDSCDGFNQEALRVINLMKKWNPGIKNNDKVRVQLIVPVRFKID